MPYCLLFILTVYQHYILKKFKSNKLPVNRIQGGIHVIPDNTVTLTLDDVKMFCQIIELCNQRGAFKADELELIGKLYNKTIAFINQSTPPKKDSEPVGANKNDCWSNDDGNDDFDDDDDVTSNNTKPITEKG